VEEPPEHLVFVFATTEPDKVLATIRSRTHHYPFRLIPPGTLRALLERICADEGAIVAPAVFPLVIRAGGGSARDTLSVLDQLLAGAGEEGVTYERAVALLGVTDVALIDDAVDALAAGDGAAVFETVDRLVEAGHDPRRFAADLLDRLRDLMLIDAVPDAAARGLVDAPGDELSRMADQASRLGPATLSRFSEILHTGLTEMRGATAPRLLLELLCGRMLLPAASTGDAALLQRLERIERRVDIASEPSAGTVAEPRRDAADERGSGAAPVRVFPRRSQATGASGSEPPAARSDGAAARSGDAASGVGAGTDARTGAETRAGHASSAGGAAEPRTRTPATEPPEASTARPDPRPAPEPAPTGAGVIDAAAVRRAWPGILEKAKQGSRSTGALLMNATVKAVEDDTLVLTIAAAPLARRLSEQRNTDVISAALRAELGVAWRVRCEHDGGQAGGRNPGPSGGNGGGTGASNGASGGNGGAADPRPASPRRAPVARPAPSDPPPPPPEPPPDDEEEML
ncbi:MAG: DNA polymerase III subunit gamma/tau, partial [Pseudonocardia sp.]|nr:DNA polymerase III subunit gamma/tau [Pseudonocardia sp.]